MLTSGMLVCSSATRGIPDSPARRNYQMREPENAGTAETVFGQWRPIQTNDSNRLHGAVKYDLKIQIRDRRGVELRQVSIIRKKFDDVIGIV